MPGQFGHDAHVQPVRGIGACIKVLYEIVAALHVLQHIGMQAVKGVGRHGGIVFPPDGVFHRGRPHDKLVFRRAAGELAGGAKARPTIAKTPLAATHRRLNERRFDVVVIDVAQSADALRFKGVAGVHASMRHVQALRCRGTRGVFRFTSAAWAK